MDTEGILSAINLAISRLEQARTLLQADNATDRLSKDVDLGGQISVAEHMLNQFRLGDTNSMAGLDNRKVQIAIYARSINAQGAIEVQVDTTENPVEAWVRKFTYPASIRTFLVKLFPNDLAKINEFIVHTSNFGVAHQVFASDTNDFSPYGFKKLPRT